jgi:argininosuccinate lyase
MFTGIEFDNTMEFLNQFNKLVICDRGIKGNNITYINPITWWVGIEVKFNGGHQFSRKIKQDYDSLMQMKCGKKINKLSPHFHVSLQSGCDEILKRMNRKYTTELLGFDDLNYNVVYAQMTRGKMEFQLASSIAALASTISKMAMDVCIYNSQNFGFVTLADEMTTGSSIMPHKKNPDVAEILRGKTNRLKALPTEIAFVQSNLPSGYHRELQIIKEIIFPAIFEINECLEIANYMIKNLNVNKELLKNTKYDLIFSVENVNKLVIEGTPFRDAYKIIGEQINSGNFKPIRDLNHTLEGSIGNLCNLEIKNAMDNIINEFNFEKTEKAFNKLLNWKV